jgi:hypothetical protein
VFVKPVFYSTPQWYSRVPQTDHGLLVIKFKLGEEEIGGPGLWRHNDEHLKTDEYQCLMSKCIDKAIVDRADEQDPAVTWEWIKFQQKVSSLKYSKDLSRLRRDNLIKAEQRYALALATHSADLIEARVELQKFVEREDEVIRFRAGIDQVEKGEKVTPFFFNQIQSKRLQSNEHAWKQTGFPVEQFQGKRLCRSSNPTLRTNLLSRKLPVLLIPNGGRTCQR